MHSINDEIQISNESMGRHNSNRRGSGYRVRIKILFQRLRCKHLNQECITNFGGDMINLVSNHRHIYRSAWRCKNCGKIIYNEKLEPTCKITNWTLGRYEIQFSWEVNE